MVISLISTLDLSHPTDRAEQMTVHFNSANLAAHKELRERIEQVPKRWV